MVICIDVSKKVVTPSSGHSVKDKKLTAVGEITTGNAEKLHY